jgi:UDP-2,3-diacylglucosamine pyrophosphatase LpxH
MSDQPFKPENRLAVFISDLHLGVGKYEKDGQWHWHKEEDFRWDKEFDLFLKEINQRGNGKTDLILNGDTFELWQSIITDCRYVDKNFGCTEEEATARIKRVISHHRNEMQALGTFADSGDNRVVFVPGNHDAALLFPKVAATVIAEIPHKPERIRIATEGYWLSTNSLVYAEHGHQIGKEVNCFDQWPRPFIEHEGSVMLQRPWGEQFVQEYYNDFEHVYPIIDNLSSEWIGILYGVKTEGVSGVSKAVSRFLKFLLINTSSDQLQRSLRKDEGLQPQWDINHIRTVVGDQFIIDSFPKDDWLRAGAAEALVQNELGLTVNDLTDDEIREICDKRYVLLQNKRPIDPCPREDNTTLAAGVEVLLRSKNEIYESHLHNTYRFLKHVGKADKRFEIFIYSHTHQADSGFRPIGRKGNWNPLILNTGAWQRVVTPQQLEKIKKSEGMDEKDILPTLEVEQLPPCYSAILVQPYNKLRSIKAELLFWQENENGTWGFSETCKWSSKPKPSVSRP